VSDVVIGILHPGAMGAGIGGQLRAAGHDVLWAGAGRSPATAERAAEAGLRDVGAPADVARNADVILSVCPPHAAEDVADDVAGFGGIYVDANAVAPSTARAIGAAVARRGGRFVDGGVIGPPPSATRGTSLVLSGAEAPAVAALFDTTRVCARVVSTEVGAASAVKMAFAAWTKGSAALLLAVRALARAEGVEDALLEHWREVRPELPTESERAARGAEGKAWRWVGEMREIATTFAERDLPDGFHVAAAEVYERLAEAPDGDVLDAMLDTLAHRAGR
jgi:3-hydroxyisobutyrate dehydrogenase-like beta-hydroxyacid dehydrogenase